MRKRGWVRQTTRKRREEEKRSMEGLNEGRFVEREEGRDGEWEDRERENRKEKGIMERVKEGRTRRR